MSNNMLDPSVMERARVEESFHDAWAKSMRVDELLVRESFESPTAAENRFALAALGGATGVRGKRLLDLGCGAGETSVFFALQGAVVTAADVSQELLRMADALAQHHGVQMKTVKIMAEAMPFEDGACVCPAVTRARRSVWCAASRQSSLTRRVPLITGPIAQERALEVIEDKG